MQLVMVGNQHQTMKAQNTINLSQISGEMKTWNTFILGSKGLQNLIGSVGHHQYYINWSSAPYPSYIQTFKIINLGHFETF